METLPIKLLNLFNSRAEFVSGLPKAETEQRLVFYQRWDSESDKFLDT